MSEIRNHSDVGIIKSGKKHFNKKKWREQKYSNKAKVQKWEDTKRKQAQRQFNKEHKKLQLNFKSKNSNNDFLKNVSCNKLKQAQMEYRAIEELKKEKRREHERIKKEKIEAVRAYKEKKAERYKKLSQKTRKGQPLMRGRIELLLEKIQKNYVNFDS